MKIEGNGFFTNPENIIGYGEIELEEDEKSQISKFKISLLMDALRSLETIGFDNVYLRLQNGFPVFITNKNNSKKGIVVCPLNED